MAQDSKQSVIIFADKLLEIEKSLSDYYDANIDVLSYSQKNNLIKKRKVLTKDANDLYSFAAILYVSEIAVELNKVNALTEQINQTLKQLENVQKAIDIAAVLVKLSAAVMMKDVGGAKDAVTEILELI
jgi:hypothetical protein